MLTSVDFFEKYKEVDTYCREKHNLENGIKEYIDAMYDFRREGRQIQGWFEYLQMLKELKQMRNDYAHEVGAFYNLKCSDRDFDNLQRFYTDLENESDPLSLLYASRNQSAFEEVYDYYRDSRIIKRSKRDFLKDDDEEKLGVFDKFIVFLSVLVLTFFAVFYGMSLLGLI